MNISISDTTSRDNCIIEMLEQVRGMVYNFARKFNLEFDDCLQAAALVMLEVWARIPDGANVQAYLNGCVRRELYILLRRHGSSMLSLDAPIAPDTTETFADMLEAFVRTQDEQREDFVAQVTHAALKECRLEEQMYARERFGLNSFNPVLPQVSSRPNYNRRRDAMQKSIRRNFSKNPQVLALMQ